MNEERNRWRIDPKAAAQERATLYKLRAVQLGRARRSTKGVPYLLFGPYSICWFWQRGFYRVFFPVPAQDDSPQQRLDFKTAEQVRTFLLAKEQEYAAAAKAQREALEKK